MAVPSSGPLSLLGIQREIFNNNYSATNSHSDISLTDLSEGADEEINTVNAAADRPDGNTPHSMSEFYNYDHDLVAYTSPSVPFSYISSSTTTGTMVVRVNDGVTSTDFTASGTFDTAAGRDLVIVMYYVDRDSSGTGANDVMRGGYTGTATQRNWLTGTNLVKLHPDNSPGGSPINTGLTTAANGNGDFWKQQVSTGDFGKDNKYTVTNGNSGDREQVGTKITDIPSDWIGNTLTLRRIDDPDDDALTKTISITFS